MKSILWFLLTLNPHQAVDAACVRHIVVPRYPRIARVAQLQGTVTVRLEVGPDGTVISKESAGASGLLRQASEDNVARWRFCLAQDATPRKHTITYVYKLEGPKEYYDSPPIVTIDLPDRVEIIGNPPEPQR